MSALYLQAGAAGLELGHTYEFLDAAYQDQGSV